MTNSTVRERNLRVSLVDLSGETTMRYTPLGAMYLRAALEGDSDLAGRVTVAVHAFLAGTSVARMVERIVGSAPDLIGFSCQGWNISVYRQMIPTVRQLLPRAVIVLGGNHVSHQGQRWLSQMPQVDLVVNGEGERTVTDLARWALAGTPALADIAGVTYRDGAGVRTTADRPRATSFDDFASPYLVGSEELAGSDVALWETNRGCPYHCSFCFWGGAVGQKLSKAEMARLRAELVTIAESGVGSIFLCDANFGILPRDVEIAALIVQMRRTYGTPHTLHVNWAKNHADRVGEILEILREGGVHANVYLALQTLSRPALALAGRDERGRPEMLRLAEDIVNAGGEVGAELIFGLPGETLDDFRAAYDQLYLRFPSLLLHPLWVLPNTTYDIDRDRFGLVTLRPDPTVDYEGVLEHSTLSRDDNRAGLALLLADDVLVGTGYGRTTMRGLAVWAQHKPSHTLEAFRAFLSGRTDELSRKLTDAFVYVDEECYFHRGVRGRVRSALFGDRATATRLLVEFVDAVVEDPAARSACEQLARYDTALLPRAELDGNDSVEEILIASFDVHTAAAALLRSPADTPIPDEHRTAVRVRHRSGFARHSADAIDLTGQWRGQVVEISSARPARSVQP